MSNEFNNLYEFGEFRLDPETQTLWRGDHLISVPLKAFELLRLLLEHNGAVVSKQEIFDRVWPDTFVEDGVLTQNIYTLRQALGPGENGKQFIENVARRGYRINVRVNRAGAVDKETTENTPKPETARPWTYTRFLLPAIAILVVSLVGYLAYRAFFPAEPGARKGEIGFQRLTDTGDASYLTISPDGKLAAYTRGFDIYVKDLATGSDVKVNIESDARPSCLQFSPDAAYIYFSTVRNPGQHGSIFRVPKIGGRPVLIAENIWSGFSVSPNGTEIAYIRKSPSESKDELIVRDLAAGAERSIKTIKTPEEFYWNGYPAWSADGSRLALAVITANEHFIRLLVVGRTGENESEVRAGNFRNVEQVVWNADGSALIAAANDGENFQIWKVSLADGSRTRITNDLNSYLGIAISADRKRLVSRQRIYYSNIWAGGLAEPAGLKQLTTGTSRNDGLQGMSWIDAERLVFTSNDEKLRDWNLFVLNTADGARQKITSDTETQNDSPVVSPDRKHIYFASDKNMESRIWRVRLDGSGPEQVTFGEAETHSFPQISPDGTWLYFIIKNKDSSTIGRKALAGSSVQELSGAKNYVPGNFLSLSPDGKFLAFEDQSKTDGAPASGGPVRIGVISTEDPENISFTGLDAWLPRAEWSRDGKYLYFITGDVRSNGIARRALNRDQKTVEIIPRLDANIFNFALSPDGENIAIARGQLSRDVVLITGLE